MLKNKKYKGDMLLQKHYTSNYLTHTQKKNNGEITQYYVENSHPAIISKEEWNAVQQEFERRERYKEQHHIKQYGYGAIAGPFCSKIFCGKCGSLYGKRGHKNREGVYWKCLNRVSGLGADACMNFNLKDDDLRKAFVKVWNKIVMNKEEKYETWNYLAQEGNELERLRARQMQELTEEGKIEEAFDEIIKMVLEGVIVKENKMLEFHFLEGTVESISL